MRQSEFDRAEADLVVLIENIVAESSSSASFDARGWLKEWLVTPNPALNGQPPYAYLDTTEGEIQVAALISRMQSGAFS